MRDRTSPDTESRAKENFAVNRRRISYQLEINVLDKTIREFFETQSSFHQNMHKLVNAVIAIQNKLPDAKRRQISNLLTPYKVLRKNIFGELPQHHNKNENIKRITDIINPDNEEFQNLLRAVASTISKLNHFSAMMKDIETSPELVSRMKREANCTSFLTLQGFLDQPFQNVIRYELLLKQLHKSLLKLQQESNPVMIQLGTYIKQLENEITKLKHKKEILKLTEVATNKIITLQTATKNETTLACIDYILLGLERIKDKISLLSEKDIIDDQYLHDPEIQNVFLNISALPSDVELKKVIGCIDHVVPEVKNINANKEIISLLDNVIDTLHDLLADEIQRFDAMTDYGVRYSHQDNDFFKDHLEFIIATTISGKENVIRQDQDICSLYNGLISLLEGLQERYQARELSKSMLMNAYKYISSYSFFSPRETPEISIGHLITQLKTTLEGTEALQELIQKKREAYQP